MRGRPRGGSKGEQRCTLGPNESREPSGSLLTRARVPSPRVGCESRILRRSGRGPVTERPCDEPDSVRGPAIPSGVWRGQVTQPKNPSDHDSSASLRTPQRAKLIRYHFGLTDLS